MPFIGRHLTALFRTFALAIFASFLLMGTSAKADAIIFSNLGPGASFSPDGGWIIEGINSIHVPSDIIEAAVPFTPTDDFIVTTINVGLMWESGANDVVLTLNASGPDGFPGQVLESWNLSNLPAVADPSATVEEVTSAGIEVHAGARYWLEASPGDPTTAAVWGENTQNAAGGASQSIEFGWSQIDTVPEGAFQVSGVRASEVPEIDPSSASTAIAMFAGALLVVRGRKKLR